MILNNNIFNEEIDITDKFTNTNLPADYREAAIDDYAPVIDSEVKLEIKNDDTTATNSDEVAAEYRQMFFDGEENLWFVPRDSILCTALFAWFSHLYNSDTSTVSRFDKIASAHVSGYVSQMLADNNEGFYFTSGGGYDVNDDLVGVNLERKFIKFINHKNTEDCLSKNSEIF